MAQPKDLVDMQELPAEVPDEKILFLIKQYAIRLENTTP